METPKTILAAALATLLADAARSQHIDVLLWDDGGRVGVGEYDFDNGIPSENRLQIGRLAGPDGPDAYTAEAPGFIALSGSDALPGLEMVEWDFLPMTVDSGPDAGYRSTLLYWDGLGESPEFGPTPTDDYEFSVFAIAGSAAATGTSEIEAGSTMVQTAPNGSIHEHPVFFLDDNGDGANTTTPEAGIYVVGLQLEIGDLTPSDPVYMIWATPEVSVLPAIRPAALWVNDRIDTLFVKPLEGDFNGDGAVDAADYTVWRDGVGEGYQPSDYAVWTANYGAGVAAPAGSAAAVPEPSAPLLLAALAACGTGARPRRFISRGV